MRKPTKVKRVNKVKRVAKSKTKRPETEDLVALIAKSADDKKAKNIKIFSAGPEWGVADYVVVVSGANDRHVTALADYIEFELKKHKASPLAMEGYNKSNWVVIDYCDVIVHIFDDNSRRFYNVDGIWDEAVGIEWDDK